MLYFKTLIKMISFNNPYCNFNFSSKLSKLYLPLHMQYDKKTLILKLFLSYIIGNVLLCYGSYSSFNNSSYGSLYAIFIAVGCLLNIASWYYCQLCVGMVKEFETLCYAHKELRIKNIESCKNCLPIFIGTVYSIAIYISSVQINLLWLSILISFLSVFLLPKDIFKLIKKKV